MSEIQKWQPQRSEIIEVGEWDKVSYLVHSNEARTFVQINTVWREVKDVSLYPNHEDPECLIYFATVQETIFNFNGGRVAVPPDDYCNRVLKSTPLMVAYRK